MQKRPLLFFILFLTLGSSSLPRAAPTARMLAPESEYVEFKVRDFFPTVCPPHAGVNEYIENHLPDVLKRKSVGGILNFPEVAGYDVAARVIPIDGLLSNTGQLYHIGLGRSYCEPVIYIDDSFVRNPIILKHALYMVSRWEELRAILNLPPFKMREWILGHLDVVSPLALQWHKEASRLHNVEEIVDEHRTGISGMFVEAHTIPFLDRLPDLLLGAGFQHLNGSSPEQHPLPPPQQRRIEKWIPPSSTVNFPLNEDGTESRYMLKIKMFGLTMWVIAIPNLYDGTGWIAQIGWLPEDGTLAVYLDLRFLHHQPVLHYCLYFASKLERQRLITNSGQKAMMSWLGKNHGIASNTIKQWDLMGRRDLKLNESHLIPHGMAIRGKVQEGPSIVVKKEVKDGAKKTETRKLPRSVIFGVVLEKLETSL